MEMMAAYIPGFETIKRLLLYLQLLLNYRIKLLCKNTLTCTQLINLIITYLQVHICVFQESWSLKIIIFPHSSKSYIVCSIFTFNFFISPKYNYYNYFELHIKQLLIFYSLDNSTLTCTQRIWQSAEVSFDLHLLTKICTISHLFFSPALFFTFIINNSIYNGYMYIIIQK